MKVKILMEMLQEDIQCDDNYIKNLYDYFIQNRNYMISFASLNGKPMGLLCGNGGQASIGIQKIITIPLISRLSFYFDNLEFLKKNMGDKSVLFLYGYNPYCDIANIKDISWSITNPLLDESPDEKDAVMVLRQYYNQYVLPVIQHIPQNHFIKMKEFGSIISPDSILTTIIRASLPDCAINIQTEDVRLLPITGFLNTVNYIKGFTTYEY